MLTVQTDCATGDAHPPGPLPAADVACDASYTLTTKLISRDPNVQLLPVSEPEAGELANAGVGAFVARSQRATQAC